MNAMDDPLRRLMALHQQQFQGSDVPQSPVDAQQGWDDFLQTAQEDEGAEPTLDNEMTEQPGSLAALRRAAGML
jgi:hypothetical protein